jgi:hypothetical protein
VSVPAVVIIVPVEGKAVARLDASTAEEQERVALDLRRRDLFDEILDALVALAAAIEETA